MGRIVDQFEYAHYGVSVEKPQGHWNNVGWKSSIFGIPYIRKFFDKVFFSIDNSISIDLI